MPTWAISAARPIQTAWLGLVLPCLALNYIGQGALLLADPAKIENPFFLLYPDWALLPMVGMATIATIIASQAVITGAFSLTQQAIQLGLLPRMEIRWTSETREGPDLRAEGQLPAAARWCCSWSSLFKSSSALAHAYGIAVTGTMVVTAIMAFFVVWRFWNWPLWPSAAVIAPFLLVDTIFLAANALKIPQGGWMPLVVGALLVTLMLTWRRGTRILFDKTRKTRRAAARAHRHAGEEPAASGEGHGRVPDERPRHRPGGAAAQPQAQQDPARAERGPDGEDRRMLRASPMPSASGSSISATRSGGSTMTFGYMETPNIPRGLALLRKQGFKFDIMATSFFVSRRSIRPSLHGGMPFWQDKLFISLAKSASDATDFFQIPTGRVVEVGTQVTI